MPFKLLALGLLLAVCTAGAQPPDDASAARIDIADPHFESVGARGIPRGVVASMAQDRAGFLWIATGDGLVRYDGYRFRPQLRDSADPARRNLGWIRALQPARDGRLWIATESQGLAVYDPASERVTIAHAAADGTTPPTITALAEGGDGAVWVGTVGAGLERYDPAAIASSRCSPIAAPAPRIWQARSCRRCSRPRTAGSGSAPGKARWRSSIRPPDRAGCSQRTPPTATALRR